jgi:hypothetical protein
MGKYTQETHMKTKTMIFILALALFIGACTVAQPTPAMNAASPESATNSQPAAVTFKTEVGDLVIGPARFVDEVNGVTPMEGHQLMLVTLSRPDGSVIDVQQFFDAHVQVFIRGEGAPDALSTMAGLVGEEFAIGFQVPETFHTYQLIWGENPPLEIVPAEGA